MIKNMLSKQTQTITRTLGFVKEKGLWYADLPEFLEQGLGVKQDLLMVDGSDRFLDILSNNGTAITLKISNKDFKDCTIRMRKIEFGLNQSLLNEVGHAPVDYGAYYNVYDLEARPFNHRLWLCPVTEYVLGGYPEEIYAKIVM